MPRISRGWHNAAPAKACGSIWSSETGFKLRFGGGRAIGHYESPDAFHHIGQCSLRWTRRKREFDEACVRLAKGYRVRLGAHPGVSSQFGRGPIRILPAAL